MKTHGSELRALLMEAIRKVADGRMSMEAGETICNLAQQANNSMVADLRLISLTPDANGMGGAFLPQPLAAE